MSGPSRENASAGRALSKRPTAAATCASTFAGRLARCGREDARAESWPPEPLQRDAVQELPVDARLGASPQPLELGRGRQRCRGRAGSGTVGTKSGSPRAYSGWSRFPAATA